MESMLREQLKDAKEAGWTISNLNYGSEVQGKALSSLRKISKLNERRFVLTQLGCSTDW